MKELSIEEKAKRYDEAVKAAKSKIKNDKDHVLYENDILDIFPELKEGEDERIRKGIIKSIIDLNTDWLELHGVTKENALAWLEKQTPITNDNDAEKASEEYRNYRMSCGIKDPVMLSEIEDAYYEGAIRKQKPEWSEKDEEVLDGIIIAVEHHCYLNNTDIDWLKSLKQRCLPQPKQEWSKKDIDMIDWLIRCCEKEYKELCNDRYGIQEIVSDLKRDCRKKWDWLESLKDRYTWKPSEEQMKLLREVQQALLGKDCHNRFVNFMYELKRLREG